MSHPLDPSVLPVEARYRFSADELIRGLKAHARGPEILKFLPYLGWLMILGFFFMWSKQDFMSAAPLALIGIFFALTKTITYAGVRRRFRTNPQKDVEISWAFSSDRISSSGEGFDQSFAWNKVFKFVEARDGFLIYPQKRIFYWIPFSGFKGEFEIECVRNLAKSQVADYRRFK